MPVGYKLRFPLPQKTQFVTVLGMDLIESILITLAVFVLSNGRGGVVVAVHVLSILHSEQ
jgi:hypothetical protein